MYTIAMLSERPKVSNGTRFISREPSSTINGIAAIKPKIFDEERALLCEFTPINFVGSMLVAINAWWSGLPFSDTGISRFSGGPIEYMTDIPVSVHDKKEGSYRSIGLVAREVLFKRACGTASAVVLAGDMAGLLLSLRTDSDPLNGMCVDRVWNDNELSADRLPYPPNHLYDDKNMKDFEKYDFGLESVAASRSEFIRERFIHIYDANYLLAARRLEERLGRIPTEVDMFFYLCKQMGIPVDIEAFHYTSKSGRLY